MMFSFFPSIFSCIRPSNNNQTSSAPLRSQSFDFFNSLEYDEEAGTITHTSSGDKKRKSRNTYNKQNGSKKGRVSLTSCIGSPKNKENSRNTQRPKSEFTHIRPTDPESPKSISAGSDSSSRQLLSSSDSEDSTASPKKIVRPRVDLNFTIDDIDGIKDLTLQLVLSCINLKETIEKTELDDYITKVKSVCESLKTLLIRVTQKMEELPDNATEELKKMQMAQTLLQTQMKHLVQAMKQAQENSHLTIANHYSNLFLQSCVHLAVYAKHFLQAFLSVSTCIC